MWPFPTPVLYNSLHMDYMHYIFSAHPDGCQTTNDTPRRTPEASQLLRAHLLIFLQLLALSTLDSQDCLSQGCTAAGIREGATCLPCQVDALSQLHRYFSCTRKKWILPQHNIIQFYKKSIVCFVINIL